MNDKTFLKDNIHPLLAIIMGVCTLAFLPFLVFGHYPKEHENIAFAIQGFFTGSFMTVLQFYFGSSSGSAKKDGLIQQLTIPNEKPDSGADAPSPGVQA